jgi:MOSC domain-containing protein
MTLIGRRDFDRSLPDIDAAPADLGRLERIVRRPAVNERELVATAQLDPVVGLVGDDWQARGSKAMPDGSADPEAQLTVISTRVLRALEPDESRWPVAGDQLYVDLDLRVDTLPAGSRLAIGDAIIEISAKPHTGCDKFAARFGIDALAWISTPLGKAHRMRGLNARIVEGGTIAVGDVIRRV